MNVKLSASIRSDVSDGPTMHVNQYCNALDTWLGALEAALAREPADEVLKDLVVAARRVKLAVTKSNLLYRLIYLGQRLRTRPCPEHKGHWSGYSEQPCPHGCSSGLDVTGWLPEPAKYVYWPGGMTEEEKGAMAKDVDGAEKKISRSIDEAIVRELHGFSGWTEKGFKLGAKQEDMHVTEEEKPIDTLSSVLTRLDRIEKAIEEIRDGSSDAAWTKAIAHLRADHMLRNEPFWSQIGPQVLDTLQDLQRRFRQDPTLRPQGEQPSTFAEPKKE